MRLVEGSEAASAAERDALGEMRRQLHEWERARADLRAPSPPSAPASSPPPPDVALTYSRSDARAQVRPARRRRAPPSPSPPSPPPSPPPAPARTRSRGTVHINLWTLDEAGAPPRGGDAAPEGGPRRRALRNGTLDAWLAPASNDRNK